MRFPLPHLFQIIIFIGSVTASLQAQSETEFKPSGKVWGYGFVDAYWKASGDTARWASRAEYSGVPDDVYAFAIRRFYLGYDYNISPKFSTYALLEGSDQLLTLRGERSVSIKSLYLKWNIYKGGSLLIGQMPTIAFSYISEKVWNYRSIEKTITDMRGLRSSSDLGIALTGVFDSLGSYGYNVMISNGAALRPEDLTPTGKHKLYAGELYGYLLDRKLILDLYGDLQTGVLDRNVVTIKAFLGFQTDAFTIGGEIVNQNQMRSKPDGANISLLGYSIFARGRIVKDKLSAFARYDSFDPDTDYRVEDILQAYVPSLMNRHYEEQFFVAGLDFTPHRNVHIMPNLWINAYSPKADAELLPERKADIVPRVTFYFIFR